MSDIKKKDLSCYCINLRRISKLITEYYDSVLKPIDISITQYSILSNVNKYKNSTITDLANHMDLDITTLVRTLKPLFAKNLIKDISKKGSRNRNLQLTKEGEVLYERAKEMWGQAQKTIENRLSEEELNQ